MTRLLLIGLLATSLLASGAAAQNTEQPPRVPEPQPPAQPAAPELREPARATPPPRPAAAAAPSSQPSVAAAPAAGPQPMAAPATLPDSVRPRAAAAPALPANAVAQCVDGTFIVAPRDASACGSHRGVLVRFPVHAPPPRPSAVAPMAALAVPRPSASPANAPPGATMQCKDGTFLTGQPAAARCGANGGLAAILPAPRTTPSPAQQRAP